MKGLAWRDDRIRPHPRETTRSKEEENEERQKGRDHEKNSGGKARKTSKKTENQETPARTGPRPGTKCINIKHSFNSKWQRRWSISAARTQREYFPGSAYSSQTQR